MNKFVKYYRLHHAQQNSLKQNLKDVLHRCLQTSDPVILKYLAEDLVPKRGVRTYRESVQALFATPSPLPDYMKVPNVPEPNPWTEDAADSSDESDEADEFESDVVDSDIELAFSDDEAEESDYEINFVTED